MSGKAQGSLTTGLEGSALQKIKNRMSLLRVCCWMCFQQSIWLWMNHVLVLHKQLLYFLPPNVLLSVLRLFATHNTTFYYMIVDLNQWAYFSLFFVPVKISVLAAKLNFFSQQNCITWGIYKGRRTMARCRMQITLLFVLLKDVIKSSWSILYMPLHKKVSVHYYSSLIKT